MLVYAPLPTHTHGGAGATTTTTPHTPCTKRLWKRPCTTKAVYVVGLWSKRNIEFDIQNGFHEIIVLVFGHCRTLPKSGRGWVHIATLLTRVSIETRIFTMRCLGFPRMYPNTLRITSAYFILRASLLTLAHEHRTHQAP